MKKLILISFLVTLSYSNYLEGMLENCYANGDKSCGLQLAEVLREKKEYVRAAEIYLDLSLKGSVIATRELSLFYIYKTPGIKWDCKKGVSLLLSSTAANTKESIKSYLEISNLFKKGICLEKDETKANKYKKIYLSKLK